MRHQIRTDSIVHTLNTGTMRYARAPRAVLARVVCKVYLSTTLHCTVANSTMYTEQTTCWTTLPDQMTTNLQSTVPKLRETRIRFSWTKLNVAPAKITVFSRNLAAPWNPAALEILPHGKGLSNSKYTRNAGACMLAIHTIKMAESDSHCQNGRVRSTRWVSGLVAALEISLPSKFRHRVQRLEIKSRRGEISRKYGMQVYSEHVLRNAVVLHLSPFLARGANWNFLTPKLSHHLLISTQHATLRYLESCSLIFEKGLLSHECIMTWFKNHRKFSGRIWIYFFVIGLMRYLKLMVRINEVIFFEWFIEPLILIDLNFISTDPAQICLLAKYV